MTFFVRGVTAWLACISMSAMVMAQAPLPATSQSAKSKSAAAAATKPARAAAGEPSGKGYRTGARPDWVVEPPSASTTAPAQDAPRSTGTAAARRELLVDEQVNLALPRAQTYTRWRAVATDASTLGAVSQPQVRFNPAFQNVVLHSASVIRDGKKLDRLKGARIELMRRETQLERLVIDGTETLLVVLSDVRVGEPVEIDYTVEGSNPIFEGRISETFQAVWETPIDMLHHRLIAPADRVLQVRSVGGEITPERSTDGKHQVLSLVRTNVAAIADEQGTPPWFKVYPVWQVSDFQDWAAVDAWAQRLFGQAQVAGTGVRAKVEALRATGLTGDALIAETLRFVQDEVRYFSVSLGESSHRPKPAERTLAERLGDCKDKTMLLVTLLTELGFDAKPALVSMARNRGIANYLPSHDHFDHVISRVQHDGRTWFLDGTITGQGTTLAQRGHYPYGVVLVVGAGNTLTTVEEPADAQNQVDHEQRWDFTKPGEPVKLTATMRARGLMAERWRAALAAVGEPRIAENMAGAFARVMPGLKQVGAHSVADDRQTNVLSMTIQFEHPNYGAYNGGGLDVEFGAVELFDVLNGPPEARRRTPFMLDHARVTTSRIEVLVPQPLRGSPPPPSEVNDRHFRVSLRVEVTPTQVLFARRIERRADEVLPANLASYRENMLRARQMMGNRLRMMLVDTKVLAPEVARIDRKLTVDLGPRDDQLARIVVRNHIGRALDDETLRQIDPKSRLAASAYASRATAGNMVGDFAAALADADKALAIDSTVEDAVEARGVALVGLGRLDEAFDTFKTLDTSSDRRTSARKWQAAVEVHRGRYAQAESLLRDVIANGSGDDRDFALLWLYIAAEHQGGRGKAAIAPHVDAADPKKLVGALLHFLDGRLDRETLLQRAKENAEMERLNLAEAYFYIGQQLAARGQREEATRWYTRTVETKALPYREVTFAKLELQRPR
jgi:lipoprotein NlpI